MSSSSADAEVAPAAQSGPIEEILSATWSDVSEQFWLVQQKEAVAFFHGKTEPPNRQWPEQLVEMPLDYVADCVEDELLDDGQRIGKEALSLIALAAHMFICETALKSWHLKGTQSLVPAGASPEGNLLEIGRGDVAFALMKTEELDWMVDNILPEYKEQKKLFDPSHFHVGFFRPVKVLDVSANNEFDVDSLVSNPEQDNSLDIWVKRDYDTQRDRVILLSTLTFRFAGLNDVGTVSGRTISSPDGTHALRCVIPSGGRIEVAFDATGNVRLDLALPSVQLYATVLCAPFYSEYQSESSSGETSEEGDESDEDESDEDESEDKEDEEWEGSGSESEGSGDDPSNAE